MSTLLQDIRYGLRLLLKSPGFTLVAVVALALGIGANTAIFSVVNAVLLRPLPYPESDRIVALQAHNPPKGITSSNISGPDFAYWREQGGAFDVAAVYTTGGAVVTGGDEPERVPGAGVSAGFFELFGARAALGRTFTPEETAAGGEPSLVLSHGLWQRRFGGDPGVVGSRQLISGRSTLVVGVMPPAFDFPQGTQIWSSFPVDLAKERRDNRYLQSVARLKDGVTLAQAQAQLDAYSRQLASEHVDSNAGWEVRATRLQDQLTAGVRPALLLLLGAVSFVLLITCANVANLLLARASARRREMAVRTALGASRARIIRQLLTESLLLSALGGAAGLLLSVWLTDLLVALSPAGAPRIGETEADWRVLSFTLGVSALVGLLFGLAPALQTSRLDLNESLKEGGRGGGEGRRQSRLRSCLVVAEVALSLVLLVGAGLLVQSLARLHEVDPGFEAGGVLTMRVTLPGAKYQQKERKAEFFQRLTEQTAALPGVESAGATLSLPLNGSNYSVGRPFIREDRPPTSDEEVNSAYVVTSGEYFRALRIPLKAGRFFDARDTSSAPPVIIINETAARRAFAGEDPVGRKIRLYRDSTAPSEIVGVVGDVRPQTLEREAGAQVYVPHAQDAGWGGLSLAVRTDGVEPESLAASVRGVVRALDPDQPVFDVRTMDEVVAGSVATRRVSALLLAVFAGLAALLAGLGLYGVIAYTVARRTHEIGVRMALGAQRRDILRLVLRQGMLLAAVGVAAGLVVALAATRAITSMLYGVSAADPVTYLGVALLLAAVALAACLVPARRATRVDPMVALRYE